MGEDWFRLPDWDAQARDEFERRLARARPYNRAQYLRIKGLSLLDAGETDGARSLWLRVLEDEGEYATVQQASALEHLGDSYASDDPLAALDFYERSLEGGRLGRGTTCTQHIKMAEFASEGADAVPRRKGVRPPRSLARGDPVAVPERTLPVESGCH